MGFWKLKFDELGEVTFWVMKFCPKLSWPPCNLCIQMQKCQMHFCYSAFANQEINTNTCLFYSLRVEVNVIIFSLSNYCSFFNKNCLNLTRGVTKKILLCSWAFIAQSNFKAWRSLQSAFCLISLFNCKMTLSCLAKYQGNSRKKLTKVGAEP